MFQQAESSDQRIALTLPCCAEVDLFATRWIAVAKSFQRGLIAIGRGLERKVRIGQELPDDGPDVPRTMSVFVPTTGPLFLMRSITRLRSFTSLTRIKARASGSPATV